MERLLEKNTQSLYLHIRGEYNFRIFFFFIAHFLLRVFKYRLKFLRINTVKIRRNNLLL